MNDQLRQSIVAFIWPGPIAGPLPLNLFRILAPVTVLYLGVFAATFLMILLSTVLVIVYFKLLELTGGQEFVEKLLQKTPKKFHRHAESKGPFELFFLGLLSGVFVYALTLRLLKYPDRASIILLVINSILSSIFWTGIFWGIVVEIGKNVLNIAI